MNIGIQPEMLVSVELQVEGTVVLGPILVMKEVHEELPAGPELPTEPVPELQTQEEEPDAGEKSVFAVSQRADGVG